MGPERDGYAMCPHRSHGHSQKSSQDSPCSMSPREVRCDIAMTLHVVDQLGTPRLTCHAKHYINYSAYDLRSRNYDRPSKRRCRYLIRRGPSGTLEIDRRAATDGPMSTGRRPAFGRKSLETSNCQRKGISRPDPTTAWGESFGSSRKCEKGERGQLLDVLQSISVDVGKKNTAQRKPLSSGTPSKWHTLANPPKQAGNKGMLPACPETDGAERLFRELQARIVRVAVLQAEAEFVRACHERQGPPFSGRRCG